MNYTTLKADVAAYLHRSDLTTQIPDFIEHARIRLGTDLRALCNQTTGTVTSFAAGVAALPSNLAALISVTQDGRQLIYVPADVAARYDTAGAGIYSVDGGDLIVPGASSSDTVDLSYWAIPAALSGGTDVSEGMAELPHIWRYASVMEGAIYLHDWDLAGQMMQLYRDAVQVANRSGRDARLPRPAMSDPAANIAAVAPEL